MAENYDVPEEFLRAMEILDSEDKNIDEYIRLMRIAEEKGYYKAIYYMALEYYTGDLLPKDEEEAKKRFQILSGLGFLNLSLLFHQVWGDGSSRLSRRKAFEYLAHGRTAEEMYTRMKELGVPEYDIEAAKAIFSNPDIGKILDIDDPADLSAEISSIARRNGISEYFMNELFEDYLIGIRQMDPDDSFGLYTRLTDVDDCVKDVLKRAQDGDPDAQLEMGMRYRIGDGVFEDENESFRMIKAAADSGNVEAIYQMGVIFDLGIGACSDDYVAEEWYKKAAELGHEEAKKIVKQIDDMKKLD